MKNNKMDIGDRVKVINSGKHYPSYKKMARLMKATKWKERTSVENGEIGIIKGVNSKIEEIVLVDFEDKEILFGIEGLKKDSREEIIYE